MDSSARIPGCGFCDAVTIQDKPMLIHTGVWNPTPLNQNTHTLSPSLHYQHRWVNLWTRVYEPVEPTQHPHGPRVWPRGLRARRDDGQPTSCTRMTHVRLAVFMFTGGHLVTDATWLPGLRPHTLLWSPPWTDANQLIIRTIRYVSTGYFKWQAHVRPR